MNDSLRKSTPPPGLKTTDNPEPGPEQLSGKEIMQAVLSRPRRSKQSENDENTRINGVVIGVFAGLGEDGQALVRFEGSPVEGEVAALTAVPLTDFDSGRQVALSFVESDPGRPLILGALHQSESKEADSRARKPSNPELDVTLDGERLTLSAQHEIVLKCGKSSITLTRAGKVIIKGEYLSNQSTGTNRIKGGSVQIN